jgi:chitodextrinase
MIEPLDAPEELPLSTDPVTAKHYEDLNTGCIYELDEGTGNYEEVYCPPTTEDLLPLIDTVPPDPPYIKTLVTSSAQQNDGTTVVSVTATVGYPAPPTGLADLTTYVLESTRATLSSGLPDWTLSSTWSVPAADRSGAINTIITLTGLLAATTYWLRVSAVDQTGNRSGWSATSTIVSAQDAVGPPLPAGVVMESGHSTIGLRWDAINVLDLAYVEVQWRLAPTGNWVSVRVAGTMTVITGLTNDSAYEVRLRSVDTSGNVLRATGGHDASGNPIYETVKVASDPNAGWVLAGTTTPTALPGNSLVWDEAMIEDIFAGNINADWITAGTLKVGGAPASAAAIEVYDALGRLIGRWGLDGIEVLDPANPGYRLIIDEASLTIWSDYNTPTPFRAVSLTPLGIDAASITFGTARGGHNLIQNSSFELGRFGVAATTFHIWTDAADWNATRVGSDVNVSTGIGELVMTTVV